MKPEDLLVWFNTYGKEHVLVHAVKKYGVLEAQAWSNSFLISALVGGEWLTSRSGRFRTGIH